MFATECEAFLIDGELKYDVFEFVNQCLLLNDRLFLLLSLIPSYISKTETSSYFY